MNDDTQLSTEKENKNPTTIDEYAEELEVMSSPEDNKPAKRNLMAA